MHLRASLPAHAVAAAASFFLLACGGSDPPPNVPTTPVPTAQYAPGTLVYRLPVVGKWRVHRTHYDTKNDQAFALDLILDAQTPRSPRNADFPSYNQPIVADGSVEFRILGLVRGVIRTVGRG